MSDIRTTHFAQLNDYRNTREYAKFNHSVGGEAPASDLPSLCGHRWEITEEIYEKFLNMMPARFWRGGSFFCCEALFDDVAAKFTKEGDRYFCEYARYPKPAVPAPAP